MTIDQDTDDRLEQRLRTACHAVIPHLADVDAFADSEFADEPNEEWTLATVTPLTATRNTGRARLVGVAAAALLVAGGAGVWAATGRPAPERPSAAETGSATPSLPSQPGSSSAPASTTPNCAITGAQAWVPNVAGMPYADAVAALASAGLEPNALREFPPPGETATDADYAVIRQKTAPGTTASCGTIVDITVAYRPGILYIVQEGDTYESIATSQGITLEQLLGFSSLTVAELELAGQDPSAPLTLGQALRLSDSPATLNTVPTTTSTP